MLDEYSHPVSLKEKIRVINLYHPVRIKEDQEDDESMTEHLLCLYINLYGNMWRECGVD